MAVYLLFMTGAYILGSLPVAYILVKLLKGIDIRTVGSGNPGATNAGRVLGRKGFAVVLFLDALKGYIPVYAAVLYSSKSGSSSNLILAAAFAVIAGHTFSCFLKFKGGKGVATGLGVFTALAPLAVGIAALAFIAVVFLFKMISLGSVVAAVILSVCVTTMYKWHGLWYFTYLLSLFVIFKHRANIKRIMSGTENKVNLKL